MVLETSVGLKSKPTATGLATDRYLFFIFTHSITEVLCFRFYVKMVKFTIVEKTYKEILALRSLAKINKSV